jgi:hypothetical protein
MGIHLGAATVAIVVTPTVDIQPTTDDEIPFPLSLLFVFVRCLQDVMSERLQLLPSVIAFDVFPFLG